MIRAMLSRSIVRRLAPVALCLAVLVDAGAPRAEDADAQVAAGAALYEKYCALCHGAQAQGYAADNAPSLVSPQFLSAADDRFLVASIALGRPGTAMAAYGVELGGPLHEAEMAQLVAYLRSRGPAASALAPPPSGSAKRGVAL